MISHPNVLRSDLRKSRIQLLVLTEASLFPSCVRAAWTTFMLSEWRLQWETR